MIEIPYPQSSTKADSGRIRPGHQAARGMPHVHIVGNLATRRLAHTKESPQSAPNGRTPCHATADGGGGCTVAAGTDGRTARKPHPPFPACFQVTHHEKYWKTKDFAKNTITCFTAPKHRPRTTNAPGRRFHESRANRRDADKCWHRPSTSPRRVTWKRGWMRLHCSHADRAFRHVWFRIRRETIHGIRAQGRAVSAYPRFTS